MADGAAAEEWDRERVADAGVRGAGADRGGRRSRGARGLTGLSVYARLVAHLCRFIAAGGRLLASVLVPRVTASGGVWALGL